MVAALDEVPELFGRRLDLRHDVGPGGQSVLEGGLQLREEQGPVCGVGFDAY
ncbi:hypothetical protein ACIQVN_02805 [Streptomyces cyaneofuscatus]|uniref:hypothetical protein n=1 Tax=Streptomyces cyaneofuscatus TaxID=66883 RepID=UPI0037FE2EA5